MPLCNYNSKIHLIILWTIAATISGGIGNLYVPAFSQLGESQDENPDISINAQISKDRANLFDKSLVYYNVKNFKASLSNDSNLCPTNDCTFKFIHKDYEGFAKNGISDRSLDGVLKVTSQGKTQLYNVNGDLSLIEEENAPDGSVAKEILEGTLRFSQGDDYYGGDEYTVNGTLTMTGKNSGNLSLEGCFLNSLCKG
jgi:hypothetical protein